jgi:hypothetical protein
MYLDFIIDLQGNLLRVVNRYSEWYTFTPNSALKEYIDKNNIYITKYFSPSDLISVVKRIMDFPFYNLPNNSQLTTLEPELQAVFGQWIIYEPDIWSYCLPHIQEVPITLSIPLQNEQIKKNFYIDVPNDLIYQNSSSRFWLHPSVNEVLTKNKQLIFSWNTLVTLFTDFCTSNNDYFSRQDESFVRINPNTSLSPLFSFNCFHINQCESILKQLTKFIGKFNSLAQLCPNLKSEYIFYDFLTNEKSMYNSVFKFIEDTINNNTQSFSEIYL